jgi:CubicO group peptidase (beta-lactamase class C family)
MEFMVEPAKEGLNRVIGLLICCLAISVAAVTLGSCAGEPTGTSTFASYLQRAEQIWHFQGTVLAARGDNIMFRKGYGFADRDEKSPNEPETRFPIGSITKPFTAIAILQLVEQGLIRLDDPLSVYLPDYPRNIADKVTIHQLLSHTSGIPDLVTIPEYRTNLQEPITPEEIVTYFKDLPLLFEPGEAYAYSSSGYALLGLVIERVSGQRYRDFVKDNICAKAGLTATAVGDESAGDPDMATGYIPRENGSMTVAPSIHPSRGYSAGALVSTVDDLFRLIRSLSDTVLLRQDTIERMLEHHAPTYGYGWLVDDFGGHRLVAHGGGLPGYAAILQWWPDDSVCVAVLSNNGAVPVHSMANALSAMILGEPYQMPQIRKAMPLSAAELDQYTGTYKLATGELRVIRRDGDRLVAQRGSGPAYPLLPEAKNLFFFAHDHLTTMTFLRDDSGAVIAHVVRQAFDTDTAWYTGH